MKGEQAEADRALTQGLTAVRVPLNTFYSISSVKFKHYHTFSFLLLEPTIHGKATVS